jgi:hypothetical protein
MSITFDLCLIENNVCSQLDTESQVNLSNISAGRVIRKLGLEFDYCGTLDRQQLLALMPKCADALVAEFAMPGDENDPYGFDRDDGRLMRLLQLFKRAIRENKEVSWS